MSDSANCRRRKRILVCHGQTRTTRRNSLSEARWCLITQLTHFRVRPAIHAWSPDGNSVGLCSRASRSRRLDNHPSSRARGLTLVPDPVIVDPLHYRQDRCRITKEGSNSYLVLRHRAARRRQSTEGDVDCCVCGASVYRRITTLAWSPDSRLHCV